MKSKARAVLRQPDVSIKRTPTSLSKVESAAPTLPTKSRRSQRQLSSHVNGPSPTAVRADYRAVRAAKEGKKYINVLIDEELQLELRPRMMLRKLTWETLIESLLRRWLKKNPEFRS